MSRPRRCWPRDPAAHASLDDPGGVAALLNSLRQAGTHEQAAALVNRRPEAGIFDLFLSLNPLCK